MKYSVIHKRTMAAAVTALAALGMTSCGDDAVNKSVKYDACSAVKCNDTQTCINGKCYDNARICGTSNEICTASQVCFNEKCQPANKVCGDKLCLDSQSCINGACEETKTECGEITCSSGTVCFNNACVDPAKICGNIVCKNDESCRNKTCVKTDKICGDTVCSETQVCINNNCTDERTLCENKSKICGENEICHNDTCTSSDKICKDDSGNTAVCEVFQTCFNGKCELTDKICEQKSKVCAADQACFNDTCVPSDRICEQKSKLCSENESCFNDLCVLTDAICGVQLCKPETQECIDNECVARDLCRNVVCTEDGQKCDPSTGECRALRVCEDITCPDTKVCASTALHPNGDCIDALCAESAEGKDYKVEKQCPAENQMCVAGVCVDDGCWVEGKPIVCNDGWVCAKGECIEKACIGKICSEGQACSDGNCYDNECLPLEEHVCNDGKVCAKGECVFEKCISVACEQNKICQEDGSCKFNADPALSAADIDDPTVDESGKTLSIALSINQQPAKNVTLSCKAAPDTQADEVEILSASVAFTPDNYKDPQHMTVKGLADNTKDGDQTFKVICTSVSDDAEFNGLSFTTPDIVNKDIDNASIIIVDGTGLATDENGLEASFSIKLTSKPSANVEIKITSSNTSEGIVKNPADGIAVISPDAWDTPQIVTIQGVEDGGLHDGAQTYQISFEVKSDDADYNAFKIDPLDVVNNDNDKPDFNVPAAGLETDENGSPVKALFSLATAPKDDVTISLKIKETAQNDELVFPDSASCTILKDAWKTPCAITIAGTADNIIDGDQTIVIIAETSSADSDYDKKTKDFSVLNKDLDKAEFIIPAGSMTVKEEGATSAELSFALASKPTANVNVEAASSKLNRVTIKGSSKFTFTPDNWNTPQKIVFQAVDDSIVNPAEDNAVPISLKAKSDDVNYSSIEKADAWTIAVLDNDIAAIKAEPDAVSISEKDGQGKIQIVLTSQPKAKVTITASSSNTGALVIEGKNSVELSADNWNSPQTIKVAAVDNNQADIGGKRTSSVSFTVTSDDADYAAAVLSAISYDIMDDETANLSLKVKEDTVTNPTAAASVTVSLSSEPTADVDVALTVTSDAGMAALNPASVKFTKKDWSPKTVSLPINYAKALKAVSTAAIAAKASSSSAFNNAEASANVKIIAMNPNDLDHFESTETINVTECESSVDLLPGTYRIQVWGASGGDGQGNDQTKESHGGLGGYAEGKLTLIEKTKIYVHYGTIGNEGKLGKFGDDAVGFGCNGGGGGTAHRSGVKGYGGGGASDVRIGADDLYHRIIVAGGGGGADNAGTPTGNDDGSGGVGGGLTGGYGLTDGKPNTAAPGTQTSGYQFGRGMTYSTDIDIGGGGAGWFGGYTAGGNTGGAGGSGFVFTKENDETVINAILSTVAYALHGQNKYYLTDAFTKAGDETFASPHGGDEKGHQGNGFVKITLIQ